VKKRKILILGGGYYQLPLIKKSRELGYYTIVCGISGNYPGYKFADKWYDVDIFDKNSILDIATREKIDGICVCGTDSVLPTLGYIVDELHLKGPCYESSVISSNKALMKEQFVRYGVRTAKYKKVFSKIECVNFINENNFPVVLKVVDASGSKGIAIVNTQEEFDKFYPEIINQTKQDYLIIEEFIEGEEFGAQSFVKNGALTFVMPHGDIVFKGNTGVPVGHYAPYEKGKESIDDITEQINRCVKALKIDNAAINADFILKDGLVYVLEIGARAGATCLPELVSCYYGIDYYEYLLKSCLGEDIEFSCSRKTPSWVETLISEKSGVVDSIQIPKLPSNVVEFELYPKVGDMVRKFENAYDRIGHIVMEGNDLNELYEQVSNLKSSIKLHLK